MASRVPNSLRSSVSLGLIVTRLFADPQRFFWLLVEEQRRHQGLEATRVVRVELHRPPSRLKRTLQCRRQAVAGIVLEPVFVEIDHRQHRPGGGVARVSGNGRFQTGTQVGVLGSIQIGAIGVELQRAPIGAEVVRGEPASQRPSR